MRQRKIKSKRKDKSFYLKYGAIVGGLAIIAMTSMISTVALMSEKTNDKENLFSPFTVTDTIIKETDYTVSVADYYFTVGKSITINNPYTNISKAVYARVKLVVTPKNNNEKGELPFGTDIDYDTTNDYYLNVDGGWVYGNDGYYYYTYVIKPGETTPELFKGGYIYLNSKEDCTIEVIADTVQAETNEAKGVYTTAKAIDAWGGLPSNVTLKTTPKS